MSSNTVFALETQGAAGLCMSGRAVAGYARYVKLIDLFISSGKLASRESVGGHKLSFLFANALHALTACIAHEEIPDVSPLAAALERAVAACGAAKPKMFDGLVIASFGLGLHAWLARGDREEAADFYVSGCAAASEAAQQRSPLCDYAMDKARGCAENLAVLRGGELRPQPSPMVARRQFSQKDAIAQSLCCAPACGKDMASMKCSRCQAVRYCNADCQRLHWAEHKKACKTAGAAQ